MRLARTPLVALLAGLIAIALAGCASSTEAGWTFAPVPSVTPAPSVASSGGPSASGGPVASAAPSSAPVASASPAASGGPVASASPAASSGPSAAPSGSADVTISALNVAFEQTSVDAPAGRAFTLLFDNKDASIPHDVWIKDSTGTAVFQGAIVTGPAQVTYNVPSLPAGSYTFNCTVHPNMTGTMVVK
jgi:plastocyanin